MWTTFGVSWLSRQSISTVRCMLVSSPRENSGRRTSEEMFVLKHATEVDKSDKHCVSGSLVPL